MAGHAYGSGRRRNATAAFELAGGFVAVVVTAFAAAVAFGPHEHAGRVLIMAVTAGFLATVLHDWRACLGVVALAALVYVGFLTHQVGQLSGDPVPWPYTLVIGLAALLGVASDGPGSSRRNTIASHGSQTRPFSVRS